ncbi:probable cytochrome P450 28a5 [Dendroctonus ponderosae]|uniref:Cytochrome P450 n=1 Tax=Dendroctonus ponderosae TaxID=77166 RepID=A0AAR5QD66_DENPD|nr:probable cytochrome P450 28a5 [Dendroctonus ponderosae]
MLVLIFLGVLLVSLIIWIKYCNSYWERRGVPGPKPWPLVGNIGSHFMGRCTLGATMREIYKTYEGYPFVGMFRATQPVLLVRDPNLVTQILTKDFASFRNNEITVDKKSNILLGHNPFVLKDQEWKDTRHMLTPGMTSGKMKNLFTLLKDIACIFVKFIENHPTAASDGIETRALTKRFTLDNVAKTAFGVDGKAFESYEDISDFNKLVDQFLKPGTVQSIFIALTQIFPGIVNLASLSVVKPEVESKLIEIISDVLKHRRANNVEASDYLQFLIELSKAKHFGDTEITAHASTFFLDGYETSSLTLSFLLFNLAQNPEYQNKIREEIKKYELENKGQLTYDALHEMPWLNACLYESLRVTPVADVLTKRCNEPFEYTATTSDFKKMSVKLIPGDVVVLPYAMTTEDPNYFESPKKFTPERMFSKDSFIKGTFHPFSDGPRACIGRRFAILQIKLGTVSVLKHFKLSVSPKMKQPMTYIPYHIFNEPKGGFWIRYKKITK